eukprot:TRINITY_DN7123_c0_g1_i1.p1 TRINITY_DN7123_c0_g1~~TRINITY_DN7123_c0_g1_i1.p1  ORF type:complete len:769 (-),score=156.73 TRINITY_DN7123_c0_g1_i1:164-2470(-)
MERATLFIQEGYSVQRLSVIRSLPSLANAFRQETTGEVLSALVKILPSLEMELQMAASDSLSALISSEYLSREQITEMVLPLAIKMLDSHNPPVANAWFETFLLFVDEIPISVLSTEILEFTLGKGEVTETVPSRTLCCQLLGVLAKRLDRETIEGGFFNKAMSLCQDTDYAVRTCMCKQLDAIARGVGLDLSKRVLLHEMLELVDDEEIGVRQAAFEAVVSLLDFFDKEVRVEHIIPLFKGLCQNMSEDMISILAGCFGEFLFKTVGDISDEDEAMIFYDAYKELGKSTNSEVRRLCAYNFPGVLKAIGARKFALHLYPTFLALSQDSWAPVRLCIASGLHEVVIILGKERAVKYLKDPFIALLQDSELNVARALAGHLDVALAQFGATNEEVKTQTYVEILPALLQYESMCSTNWRLEEELLRQWDNLPNYFTSDQIHDHLIPVVTNCMKNGATPVKTVASRLLCVFIRKNRYAGQRARLCRMVVDEFAKAKSYWHRIHFLDFCVAVLDVFSRKWFKEHFFNLALELAQDKVPNVRLRLCALLPQLKKSLMLPDDDALLEKIKDRAALLMTDSDKDVSKAAHAAAKELSRIQPRRANSSRGTDPEEEAADKRKLEEEASMLKWEEKEAQEAKKRLEQMADRARYDYKPKSLAPDSSAAAMRRKSIADQRKAAVSASLASKSAAASGSSKKTSQSRVGGISGTVGSSTTRPTASRTSGVRSSGYGQSSTRTTASSKAGTGSGRVGTSSSRVGASSSTRPNPSTTRRK